MAFTLLRSDNSKPRAIALMAAMMLGLAACSGSPSTNGSEAPASDSSETASSTDKEASKGGEIRAASAYDLSGSIDPATTSSAVTLAGNWHVMEGLVELDRVTGEPYAALAKELPKVDNNSFEVDLRDDAKFSDGTDVKSEDVVFSYNRVLENTDGFYDDFINFIDKVEAVDDDTVKFTMKNAFSLVDERLSVVKIVPKALVEKDKEAYGQLPVGTGPWKYETATPNEKITFKPNEHYNGPKPAHAETMTWDLLADPAARVTALMDETVSVIENVPATDKENVEGAGYKVESVDSFGLAFMLFNTKKAPWDKVEARQALFYALDVPTLINDYAGGDANPAKGFLNEKHPNFHQAKNVYTYDVAKAKELLAKAGVKEGQEVTLRIAESWISPMAPAIQQQLEAVGLKVTLKEMPSKALYPEIDSGDNDVVIAPGDPSVFGSDPDLLMRWWYGKNVWSETRYAWSENSEFTKLQGILDEAVKLEGKAQQDKWNEAFDLLSEQVPLYPLMHRKVPTAYNEKALENFKPVNTTGLNFIDVSVAQQ